MEVPAIRVRLRHPHSKTALMVSRSVTAPAGRVYNPCEEKTGDNGRESAPVVLDLRSGGDAEVQLGRLVPDAIVLRAIHTKPYLPVEGSL